MSWQRKSVFQNKHEEKKGLLQGTRETGSLEKDFVTTGQGMRGLLRDPRLAHPANLGQRVVILRARQQAQGNRAVQRMVQPFDKLRATSKLTVGQPGDRYEQEADRVAETVLRMPQPHVQRQEEEEEEPVQTKPLTIQRQEEEEEEPVQTKPLAVQRQVEEEEEPIQAKPLAGQITPLIQRQEEEEELPAQAKPLTFQRQAEEEEEPIQTKSLAGQITPLIQRQEEEGPAIQRQEAPPVAPLAPPPVVIKRRDSRLFAYTKKGVQYQTNILDAFRELDPEERPKRPAFHHVTMPVLFVDCMAGWSKVWAAWSVSYSFNGKDLIMVTATLDKSNTWKPGTFGSKVDLTFKMRYAGHDNGVVKVLCHVAGSLDPAGRGDIDFEGKLIIRGDGKTEPVGMLKITRGDPRWFDIVPWAAGWMIKKRKSKRKPLPALPPVPSPGPGG